MLAVLFVLALLGYAVIYTGLAGLGSGSAPGIIESLSPGFTGADLRSRGTSSLPSGSAGSGVPAGTIKDLTPALQAALPVMRAFVAARFPGRTLQIISTFRPGAVVANTNGAASEHAFGNAADVKIVDRAGHMDTRAMDGLYAFLKRTPYCELCWNHQGGCTTSHTDHLHYSPRPCRAG